MLADKLKSLGSTVQSCRIDTILKTLTKEDASAFVDALRNPRISVRSLSAALTSEGHSVSRDSIAKGRMCALNPSTCKCQALAVEVGS